MAAGSGHRLTFGDLRTNGIEFGPIEPSPGATPPFDVFECPIAVTLDGSPVEIGARQGVEGYALANLRSNLTNMLRLERGTFWFGDHDYGMFVEITGFGDGGDVALTLDLPHVDRWDAPLPPLSVGRMRELIATIDSVEDDFGPLTGACDACGIKDPMFHTDPYRSER